MILIIIVVIVIIFSFYTLYTRKGDDEEYKGMMYTPTPTLTPKSTTKSTKPTFAANTSLGLDREMLYEYTSPNKIEGFDNSTTQNQSVLPSETVKKLYSTVLENLSPALTRKLNCATANENKNYIKNMVNCIINQFYTYWMVYGYANAPEPLDLNKINKSWTALVLLKYMFSENVENPNEVMTYDVDNDKIKIISPKLITDFQFTKNEVTLMEFHAAFKQYMLRNNIPVEKCGCETIPTTSS